MSKVTDFHNGWAVQLCMEAFKPGVDAPTGLNVFAHALADAEQRGAERERAAVVRHLRSMGHHIAAGDIEAGKHREDGE